MGFQARVDGNRLERHATVLFSLDWLKGSHGRPMRTSTYTRHYAPASFSPVTSFRNRANNANLAAGLRGGTPPSLQRRQLGRPRLQLPAVQSSRSELMADISPPRNPGRAPFRTSTMEPLRHIHWTWRASYLNSTD